MTPANPKGCQTCNGEGVVRGKRGYEDCPDCPAPKAQADGNLSSCCRANISDLGDQNFHCDKCNKPCNRPANWTHDKWYQATEQAQSQEAVLMKKFRNIIHDYVPHMYQDEIYKALENL